MLKLKKEVFSEQLTRF